MASTNVVHLLPTGRVAAHRERMLEGIAPDPATAAVFAEWLEHEPATWPAAEIAELERQHEANAEAEAQARENIHHLLALDGAKLIAFARGCSPAEAANLVQTAQALAAYRERMITLAALAEKAEQALLAAVCARDDMARCVVAAAGAE